jgi:hypothetical protein
MGLKITGIKALTTERLEQQANAEQGDSDSHGSLCASEIVSQCLWHCKTKTQLHFKAWYKATITHTGEFYI